MSIARRRFSILALVALIPAVCHAQPAPPNTVGSLGNRYVEVSSGLENVGDDLFERKYFGAVQFNFPITAAVDLGFGGTTSRTSGSTVPGMLSPSAEVTSREWGLRVEATAYLRGSFVVPFVRASGGYEWLNQDRTWVSGRFGPGRLELRERHATGVFGAGTEVLVKRLAVTPSLHYQDTHRDVFGTDVGGAWRLDLVAHLCLTRRLGVFVHGRRTRPRRESGDSLWAGEAGVRFVLK